MIERRLNAIYWRMAATAVFTLTIIAGPSVYSSTCEGFLKSQLRPLALKALQKSVDGIYALWPRPRPTIAQLNSCRLISHRGAHTHAPENTAEAFELCRDQNIWGIEFDIRWTKDNEPILLHDVDAGRVFGRPDIIPAQMSLAELQNALPEIPTLEQIVQQFGERFHLMIEFKESLNSIREDRLKQILQPLKPIENYHFLSLRPELFENVSFVPGQTLLIVSETNPAKMSEAALKNNWGGIMGHYLLLDETLQQRHLERGQVIGTGFVNSKHNLYRAIHRGVSWVFTNRPLTVAPYLDK